MFETSTALIARSISGCLKCRVRHSVTGNNPLFPTDNLQPGGHGSYSPSFVIFVMHMVVMDCSLTHICRELGVSEPWARMWAARTRFIMAMSAEWLQQNIVFGQLENESPAYIELDESCAPANRMVAV